MLLLFASLGCALMGAVSVLVVLCVGVMAGGITFVVVLFMLPEIFA